MIRKLKELWQYRELVRNLVVRDLKARYKSSLLGIAWSWLNPLLMMVVYSILFTIFLSNDQIGDYPIFLLAGLLPWNFFNDSIMQGTGSVVGSAHLIKKVYFPREVLPISVVMANLVNFLLALPVFFILALIVGRPPTLWALLLPLPILMQVAFSVGLVLFLSTLNVFYRDTQIILGVVMLAWFFLTPIFYPLDTVPQHAVVLGMPVDPRMWLLRLNPMASIVTTYRELLYWGVPSGWDFVLRTAATSLAMLVLGYVVFQRHSRRFGEEV